MAYLGKTPSQAVRSRYYFTASGGETSLSGTDDNGNTLTYTDGNYVDVSLNGVALVAGSDYNTTTANTIGGLTALTASDVVEVVVYDTFSVFSGAFTGDISLGDNVKAKFGASDDLQIYHTGTQSIIEDVGTGPLRIRSNSISIENELGTETISALTQDGAVTIYYDGSPKLATTSSGIDVTGTVTADGLTVDNAGVVRLNPSSGDDFLTIQQGGSQAVITADSAAGAGNLVFRTTSAGSDTDTMLLAANGDISFYDNTGTTQGLFWDASTQRLGLGTTGPSATLHVDAPNTTAPSLTFGAAAGQIFQNENSELAIGLSSSNPYPLYMQGRTNGNASRNISLQPLGGNVGIGESNPLSSLHIDATNGAENFIRLHDGNSDYGAALGLGSTGDFVITAIHGGIATEALRVDRPTGNVGIGTSSPGYSLQIGDGTASENMRINSSGTALISITSGTSSQSRLEFGDSGDDDIGYIYYDNSNNSMQFATNTSERLRIDSSGRLRLGGTFTGTFPGNDEQTFMLDGTMGLKADGDGVRFYRESNSSQVGAIVINTSSTSYNTSSDHRLKENVADMTGAIDRVKALAPKRFNFIADADTTVDGFLAHEAQAVVPEAVTGTHNEVDEDGNAVMQGIDQSKLVPLLTGALQEAIAKIEALETSNADMIARIETLENAE